MAHTYLEWFKSKPKFIDNDLYAFLEFVDGNKNK